MSLRSFHYALLAVTLVMAPAASEAAPIVVAGNASGCFGTGCTPTEDATSVGGLLEYESNLFLDFWGLTDPVDGTLAINGNFGRIEVNTARPFAFVNTPFSLLLDFYAPTVGDLSFSASIFGLVSLDSVGGVVVLFNPAIVTAPYSTGSESGTLHVAAFSTAVSSGGSRNLNGFVVAQSVPEPATSMLFGLGALGLFVARKRRA